MGLFKEFKNRISELPGFGNGFGNTNTAPDFLGRTSSGGLFGGMKDMVNTDQQEQPNMNFSYEGGGKFLGDNKTPGSGGFLGDNKPDFGGISQKESELQPELGGGLLPQPQQQMPFFGMQNPMSNMFGMGQAMNPYAMGGMNPMMGMMSMMMQPMMQMMSMFNPFMNPFGGGMGGGGMFGNMGQGIRNMFGYGMPQMRMPLMPRRGGFLKDLMNRVGGINRERDQNYSIFNQPEPPNYGAFLNPDGSDFGGIRTMDFQDRDGDGIDDRYQRGPSTDMERYQMAVEDARRKREDGFTGRQILPGESSFEDFIRNQRLNTTRGMPDQMMQDRVSNLSPYTMTQQDNMAISDNSDPQGEEQARLAVQQALAGPQRGLIGNAISRLFG